MYYTYLLHFKPTNQWYYGVRWKKGCYPDEFWKTYYTSSNTIQLLRTLFGDDCWEFEIRKTFKSNKQAASWENKVLRRMKVLENKDIWLNKTNNKSFDFDSCRRGAIKPKTDMHKEKISNSHKGMKKPWVSEYNRLHRKYKRGEEGKKTEQTKERMRAAWTIEKREAKRQWALENKILPPRFSSKQGGD